MGLPEGNGNSSLALWRDDMDQGKMATSYHQMPTQQIFPAGRVDAI